MDHHTRKPSQTFISVGSRVTFYTAFFSHVCLGKHSLLICRTGPLSRIICVESSVTLTLLAHMQESSVWY